jgi:hypothetical protein
MSLPLAIVLVVLADLALIGLLAFVMSHAARLTPHQSSIETGSPRPARASPAPASWLRASPRSSTARAAARSAPRPAAGAR